MALPKGTHAGQITDTYTTEAEDLGTERMALDSNGYWNKYEFVKVVDSVDVTVGMVMLKTSTPYEVTPDYAGGSGLTDIKATGVAISAITITDGDVYCWILKKGYGEVLCDGGVAAAVPLVAKTDANDGEADDMADGEEELVFAYSLEADDDSTKLALSYVDC